MARLREGQPPTVDRRRWTAIGGPQSAVRGRPSPTRIAFLCTSGIDNASPLGRWLPVARELTRHGHELHLLLLHPTYDRLDAAERSFTRDGVQIHHVAQMHVYGQPGARRFFGGPKLAQVALHAVIALARAAIALRPDVLHICKPQPINGAAGWLAAHVLHIPWFVDCDDLEVEANRMSSPLLRAGVDWWERHLPHGAHGVTVNTRFLYERFLRAGIATDRIAYIPNGADATADATADAAIKTHPRCVAYVGTMSTVAHGVDLLLDAFAQVAARVPGSHLLMVGDGDDRPALQARAQALGISDRVTWCGRVPRERARTLLAGAACSVDPVRDEDAMRARSPLKIVESLAAGVPVVTGDVGDRRELLGDGQAGLLVSPSDAAALADAIARVLENDALRAQLAAGARERRMLYRWEVLAEKWAALYSQTA